MATNTQTLAVIARLLDLTERRVQQLGRDGVIPKAEHGRYDLVGAVRGYVRYLRDQAARSQSGVVDFGAERARLVKAKADLAEMDAESRRGDLLPAAQVEEAWIAVLARLRSRLLVLPDRLAPLVHEETTLAGARNQIRHAIAEALTELATVFIVAAVDPERPEPSAADGDAGAHDPGPAAGGDDR